MNVRLVVPLILASCSDGAPAPAEIDEVRDAVGEGEGEGEGEGDGQAPIRRARYDDALAWVGDFPGRGAELQDVALTPTRAYLCSGNGGLHVIDTADRAAPVQRFPPVQGVGSTLGLFGRCQHLAADGVRVFATARVDQLSPSGMLLSARVDNARQPEVRALVESDLSFEGLSLDGDRLYVAAVEGGVRMFDVAVDGSLEEAGVLDAPNALDVRVREGVVAVALGKDGLWIDGRVHETQGLVRDIEFVPDRPILAVAAGPAGLQLWDLEGDEGPVMLGAVEAPGTVLDVAIGGDGSVAFVATFNDVRVFDIEDPTAPRLVATERVRTPNPISRPLAVATLDDMVGVAEWGSFALHEWRPSPPSPQAVFTSSEIDFGRLAPGAREAKAMVLTNVGDADLVVDGGIVFTTAPQAANVFAFTPSTFVLAPGQSEALEVDATAPADVPLRGLLRLFTDDPDARALEIPLRANDPGLEVGAEVPPLEALDLDGAMHRLSDHAGSVVLLAWFGTYCPVCAPEMSDLEVSVWRRFADRGLVVWGLNPGRGDTAEVVRTYASRLGLSFPLLWDEDDWWQRFEESDDAISAFPIQVLLGRDGRVRLVRRRYERSVLVDAIEAALEEAP